MIFTELNSKKKNNKFDLFYPNVTATPRHWSNGFKIPYLMSNDDSWNKNHKVSLLIQPWHNTNVLMITWPWKDRPIKIPSFKSGCKKYSFSSHIYRNSLSATAWVREVNTHKCTFRAGKRTDGSFASTKAEQNWSGKLTESGDWQRAVDGFSQEDVEIGDVFICRQNAFSIIKHVWA